MREVVAFEKIEEDPVWGLEREVETQGFQEQVFV